MISSFNKFTAKYEFNGEWNCWFIRSFIFKPTEKIKAPLKNSSRDFKNKRQFKRSTYFYMTITGDFKRFHYFNFNINFLEKQKPFLKNWTTVFRWRYWDWKHNISIRQTSILRQVAWGVQNVPFTKNAVLPLTFSSFCKLEYKSLL